MTEHMTFYPGERVTSAIDLIQSPEWDTRQAARLGIGIRAVGLSGSLGTTMQSAEQVYNTSNEVTETGGMEDMVSNPEGRRNAELFKQAYDAAIEAIESAYESDSTELGDKLVAILDSIDALSGTPYISSAPEFVELVKAARHNVEQAHTSTSSGINAEATSIVASALSRARQQLTATTVAYRP